MKLRTLLITYLLSFSAILRINSMKHPECNVLAFSGGGSYGALELGILESLIETQQAPDNYDIMTGISAGGLNAGFFSYYNNATEALADIKPVMFGLSTEKVYSFNLFRILSSWSFFDTTPLENTLKNILSSKTQQPNGPITLIGASNVNSKVLDIFRFHEIADVADRVAVLMSTSAIPILFPPQLLNGSLYVDGGVINNELITQSLGEKSCSHYNVTFLSAIPPQSKPSSIDGIFSYLANIVSLLFDTFDNQVAQFANDKCSKPRGNVKACYPTNPAIFLYSILDFNNEQQLFTLGKNSYTCQDIPLC